MRLQRADSPPVGRQTPLPRCNSGLGGRETHCRTGHAEKQRGPTFSLVSCWEALVGSRKRESPGL